MPSLGLLVFGNVVTSSSAAELRAALLSLCPFLLAALLLALLRLSSHWTSILKRVVRSLMGGAFSVLNFVISLFPSLGPFVVVSLRRFGDL